MKKSDLVDCLKRGGLKFLESLFRRADEVRREHVGDEVHLRGIVEFSSYCARDCLYCGLRRSNLKLKRYRMKEEEIIRAASEAVRLGIPTVVLQSGEDGYFDIRRLCSITEKIKKKRLAVTLSVGERSYGDYRMLRDSGADRYLLRFESSDKKLYKQLRPGRDLSGRLRCLHWLKKLGYEAGSGIMVGLPGQSLESIASDILLFKSLDLDMIGIGPFIPHPNTPLSDSPNVSLNDVLKVLALSRIVTKNTNIPATTAVGTIDPKGRQKALSAGANVIMPNITPVCYRSSYQIYPDKICLSENAFDCRSCVGRMINAAGRKVASGYGWRLK